MTGERVSLTPELLVEFFDALHHARRFFAKRDEMNAEVHLAEPRWSPLTYLVANAETKLQEVLEANAIIGAPIQHDAHPRMKT
jgi:hypothetical protein